MNSLGVDIQEIEIDEGGFGANDMIYLAELLGNRGPLSRIIGERLVYAATVRSAGEQVGKILAAQGK